MSRVRDTITLAQGESVVELPEGCYRVVKVSAPVVAGQAPQPVQPVPDRWMQHNAEGLTTRTGPPELYTDGGYRQDSLTSPPVALLRLFPVADKSYDLNVTYLRRGVDLTADTQYPPFPIEFDEAIILWVLRQYYRQVESPHNMTIHNQAYDNEIRSLQRDFGYDTVERFPRVMQDFDNYELITDPLNGWG